MSSTQPLKTIAIAGAGTMGASMAGIFSAHAYDVILYDISPSALDRALASRIMVSHYSAGGPPHRHRRGWE